MSVLLTGLDLTLEEVVRVARGGERVELAPAAIERMRASRDVVARRRNPSSGVSQVPPIFQTSIDPEVL